MDSVPRIASIPSPRRCASTKLGRCLNGTPQIRLNAFWVAPVMPMPASSEPITPTVRPTPLPVSDFNLSSVADDRELPEGAVEDPLLLAGVALEHEAEHGDEHEQQREQRNEAVVGDQSGELPGLVVAELLDHGGEEADSRASLLAQVERVQAVGEAHRTSTGRARAPSSAERAQ